MTFSTTTTASTPRHQRRESWCFGPPNPFSEEEAAWWRRHQPTIDRWLSSMEEADDPWWQAAEHAAFCLVSSREGVYTWDGFSVSRFLFEDLWEGGTVGFFGSTEKFFDHLVEALQRFVSDAVVEASAGERWIAQMQEAREDFLRCFDEATPGNEAAAIAARYMDKEPRTQASLADLFP